MVASVKRITLNDADVPQRPERVFDDKVTRRDAPAREAQFQSVQLIALLASRGYMGAAKATMKMLGVDVGPARLPNGSLNVEQQAALRTDLEQLGFFDWVAKA